MFVNINGNELIVCKVSPMCDAYGKTNYPIFVFYPDGTYSKQVNSFYYRSILHTSKPFMEFTLNELKDVVYGNVHPLSVGRIA